LTGEGAVWATLRSLLGRLRGHEGSADALTRLADRFGTDKGARSGGHHYTRIYSQLFEPLREQPVRLLEIGLLGVGWGGWDDDGLRDSGKAIGRDAPSLRMWAEYFPRGEIFGIDFNDFSGVHVPRCRILRADASEPAELQAALARIGGALDVVIDDGSHASHHQQIALATLFSALRPGGIYVIEDLDYQPADREPAGAIKTVEVLRRAEVAGQFRSPHLPDEAAAELDINVEGIALFDSLAEGPAIDRRGALGVLWKRS
jgi:SAM-dependent methyltransferase